VHSAQHLPVEVRRPTTSSRYGRGASKAMAAASATFSRRLRVGGAIAARPAVGRSDGGIGRVGGIRGGRIAILLAAHQQDGADRRFLGLATLSGWDLRRGRIARRADGGLERRLAVGRFGMALGQRVLRLDAPRAPGRIGDKRPQGKLFQIRCVLATDAPIRASSMKGWRRTLGAADAQEARQSCVTSLAHREGPLSAGRAK